MASGRQRGRSPGAAVRVADALRGIACALAWAFAVVSLHTRGQSPAGLGAIPLENLPARELPSWPAPAAPIPWVQTDLRVAHLPPADWRQISEFIKAGYQVIAVNTLAQWDRVGPGAADYPTNVVREADAYLRRFVDQVHGAGARAVFYLGPVQSPLQSDAFRERHPEWLRVNEDGSRARDYVNVRNPQFVDWLCRQLAYLAREYRADGFWMDGYSPVALHTYDTATRAAFREHSHGLEIPPRGRLDLRDPATLVYLQWHESYFVALADRIRSAVRAANPGTVLYGNYSASRTWFLSDWPRGEYPSAYARAIDLPSVELYWDNPGDALFQHFTYAFTQAASRDRGARVWVQPHAHGTLGTPPDVEILLRSLEGAPWGVYSEFVEPTEQERHHRLYVGAVKARERWWRGSEALPYIGIVASEQTRLWMGRDTLPAYLSHALGMFRALFEAHLPVRLLTDDDLEDGDLQGVRVLVLPDVRVMSTRGAEVVRRFVRNGGGLVASRGTSLVDASLHARTNFALADLFHADYAGSREVARRDDRISLWIDETNHPIVRDPVIAGQMKTAWRNPAGAPPATGWLEVIGSATQVVPRPGGEVIVRLSTNESHQAMSPALITSRFGTGRVAYWGAGVDQAMFFFPNSSLRALLVEGCRWAAGDVAPPVQVSGPLMLATTFRRQPGSGRVIVHLLNDHSSEGRHSLYQRLPIPGDGGTRPWSVREEIIPLHDVRVISRVPGITRATLQPGDQPLPLTRLADGSQQAVVPVVEMYSIVVLE